MHEDLFSWMNNIDRHHNQQHEEFLRLCAEPCMKPVNPGDRVIVAVGFIDMGFPWVRMEGIALEVGGGSVKVRLNDTRYGSTEHKEVWIHPALIVDVFEVVKIDPEA